MADSGTSPSVGVVTISAACPDSLTKMSTERLIRSLDETERSHLATLKAQDAQRQYLVAHVLLRNALSAQYPAAPSEWRFSRTQTGQPVICHPEAAAIFFSLSHTRSLVACAVSAVCAVGIDVERIDASIKLARLADRVLSEHERKSWAQEGSASRLARFYRLWTLKEALLKAVGQGLRYPPLCVGFHLPDGRPPELTHLPPELGDYRGWSFRAMEPTSNHACALAVRISPRESLRVNWQDVSVEELADTALVHGGLESARVLNVWGESCRSVH